MSYPLAQIILAARNNDVEGWMQMLVFIVLALFWVIGGILKARANKLKDQEQEQPEGTSTPEAQRRPQIQPPRRKVMRPRPAVQKFAAKTEQDLLLETLESLEAPELPLPRPQLQPDVKEPKESISRPVERLKDEHAGIPAETHQARSAVELLLDFDDPDKLKRAILHYEILGKPLALRNRD